MHKVFLGIGGNIGNKRANFDKVYTHITNGLGEIIESSSVYETAPWGFQSDKPFWNQVLIIESQLSPTEILGKIEEIDEAFGRKRDNEGYSSREMDIDILYYDDLILETEILIIPHPRIAQRLFVLVPLSEIAPRFVHPLLQKTSIEMLNDCIDKLQIEKV